MRILLATPECPLPLLNGTRLRSFHLFSRLAHQHEVTLVSFAEEEEIQLLPSLREFFSEVHLVPKVRRRSIRDYAYGVFSLAPFFVKRMHSAEMAFHLGRLTLSGAFDVVHVSDLRMAHYMFPYEKHAKVVDACDCLSLLYRRAFFNVRLGFDKLNYLQLWLKARAYERRVYASYDRCLVVSQTDADALRLSSPALPLKVIPNGVDAEHFRPSPAAKVVENSFVFVGVLSYRPNIDAATFFATKILPKIAEEVPSASFEIVGRSPTREILELQRFAKVRVVADVDDVRPYVWRTAAFVCPLRIGAGIKNKVLEAMAMGKPVVATPLASEGLEVVPGQDLLIAEGPDEFARKCVKVLKEKEMAASLGSRARGVVDKNYSWSNGVRALEETLREVARGPAREQLAYSRKA